MLDNVVLEIQQCEALYGMWGINTMSTCAKCCQSVIQEHSGHCITASMANSLLSQPGLKQSSTSQSGLTRAQAIFNLLASQIWFRYGQLQPDAVLGTPVKGSTWVEHKVRRGHS